MADDAQIFNIRTSISPKRLKLETSNLVCASTTRSDLNDIQKAKSVGMWPCSGDLDLDLRNSVDISRTAEATWFKFIMQKIADRL